MQILLVGYMLIILCPAAAGFLLSHTVKERLKRVEGAIELVRHCRYKVCDRLCPQNEIFMDFDNSALERCGFVTLLRSLDVSGGPILYRALKSCPDIWDKKTYTVLNDFARTLGNLNGRSQAESCDHCISALCLIYEKMNSTSEADMKLYRSMGMLTGVMTALLLI